MPRSDLQVLLAEPAGATSAARALERLGEPVRRLDLSVIDAACDEPERLAEELTDNVADTMLVIALAAQEEGPVARADWPSQVDEPLRRCFTLVRGLVPTLLAQGAGAVVAVLPPTAILADAGRTAESVLGRSAIGFFEGLRAELLSSSLTISIVIADERETEAEFADRVAAAIADDAFYSLPASITKDEVAGIFAPWLDALAQTPVNPAMPPMGPMGEVYRTGPRVPAGAR